MSVILAGLSCLIIYFTCEKSIQFFLGNSLTPDEDDIAKKIMYYGILGFLPDSLRIMSGGLLRGWNDLVTPTLASIISMTVIAIPIGAIIGLKCDKQDSAYPLFWLRIAGIALSALFNYYRFFCQHMKNEMADLHRMQSSVLSSPGQDELRASDIDANTTPHRKERDSAEIKVSNNANLFFSHSPRQHQLPVGNANTNSIQ